MGAIPLQGTHDPRPTGKLTAARWLHEHLRLILLSAILSFALTICLIMLLHGASAKSVTVVDGGKSTVIQTRTSDVSALFKEAGITVGPNDQLSAALTSSVEDGTRVVIDRAMSVQLVADGKKETKYTTLKTVGDLLKNEGITLSAEDKVTPALTAKIDEGLQIKVVRVKREVVTTEHPLAYKVVKTADQNLLVGKTKVVQTGKQGLLVKKFERVYEDGKLVDEQLVYKSLDQPIVQQVVAVGAKKKAAVVSLAYNKTASAVKTLQLNGKSVKVKSVLSGVTLTAYSAGPASTGKDVGDVGYGITASGTTVSEGRTIAVDPDVVPLGWWVYIEGIGFRRAEDTGSAIKGKKIDVYYDSERYANKFGKKRGNTVYVIGPVKPSAD
ncbi:ubiquitin-like domain-containing protein [Cohnella ginsengisoli]|uniref:Ubiquitin-like domain-containing protein n=1 Tax=Cohnella ginsengisoli TaxID=425004 RepID=A0A9X4KNM7_9BACL|nr:3D domain-containing protein [Cohnella ginsengisoli]MDG0795281.1 ubiquitin-like domain-containing protein [Cohnella ginsengisoli]